MRYLILFWASLSFSAPLTSSWVTPQGVDAWSDDFVFDHESFAGDWISRQNWKGTFCNGDAGYRGRIGGHIEKIRFKLEDKYIEATADMKDIWGNLSGSYRSGYSACARLSGQIGADADWAHLRLHVYMNPSETETQLSRIEIKESVLGRIRFGLWLPSYLEEYATKLVNRGLEKVWSSWIGDWISQKISEKFKKRKHGPSPFEDSASDNGVPEGTLDADPNSQPFVTVLEPLN